MQAKLHINGEFIPGGGVPLRILHPAMAVEVASIPGAGPAQTDAAVEAAATAVDTFSRTAPKERTDLLSRIADVIEANSAGLAERERSDVGRLRPSAHDDEMVSHG